MSVARIHVQLSYERPTQGGKGELRAFVVKAQDVPPKDKNGWFSYVARARSPSFYPYGVRACEL
jgi:hypothetical protein